MSHSTKLCILLSVALLLGAAPAQAATFHVDIITGSDAAGTGSPAQPFRTIGRGLHAAVGGDTVVVRTGLYNAAHGERFPIRMKHGVVLQGTSYGARRARGPDGRLFSLPVIHGGRSIAIDPAGTRRSVAVLGASSATLSRFVVYAANSRPGVDDGVGVLCRNVSTRIGDNWFRGDGHAGVTILESAAPTVHRNGFYGHALTWGVTAHGYGASVILENRFYSANGIDVTQQARPYVKKNKVTCRHVGVRVQNQARPEIYANSIYGNGSHGVMINDSPTPVIHNNEIIKNGHRDGRCGILVLHGARPDLGGGPMHSPGRNVIRDNHDWDIRNQTPHAIPARFNTWTHAAPADIDLEDIFDDDEAPGFGPVIF
jgi:parallel beta-helix repeat protein